MFIPSVGRYGRRQKGVVLELGALSPSDTKHTFQDFRLESVYPYQMAKDFHDDGEAYKQRAAERIGFHDRPHGWVEGQRDDSGIAEGRSRG